MLVSCATWPYECTKLFHGRSEHLNIISAVCWDGVNNAIVFCISLIIPHYIIAN